MTDTAGTNDDWLPDAAPPTEATLRDQLANAPVAGAAGPKGAGKADGLKEGSKDAGKAHASGRGGDGKTGRPRGEIFEGSPVTPLGIDGDDHLFLDTRGQLRKIGTSFQKNAMLSVFGGRAGLLASKYPVYPKGAKSPKPGDFEALKLATDMILAATERGVWSPVGRVRGPGAWTDEDGRLVWHAGDEVLIGGRWQPPGVYGGHVYPADNPAPRPAEDGRGATAALEVLELAVTWNWARPDLDPMLVLGVICAQMVGGALDWRPVPWLTGDQATGKSTFQRMLRHLHGGTAGLLQAEDATEAGIRSIIGFSSLPVALDELEPDDDPRKGKAAAIIRLARIAASGGQILRGSTDQKGYQGNAYSSFLFSSILIPPLPPQDRSRLILLNLDRIGADAPRPKDDPRRLRALGGALRRRLIDLWPTWTARLEAWRAALAEHGHGGREADNYGTVLGLADLALHDAMPDADTLANWCAKLARHLQEDSVDQGSNADDMLSHLMSQPLDVWRRGQRVNVATWLAMAARLDRAPEAIDSADAGNANRYLAQYGLRVAGRKLDARLVIANKPLSQLCQLFDGTPWAGGVWAQAARRVPGAQATKTCFARVSSRAYEIPFTSIPGLLNAMDDTGVGLPLEDAGGADLEGYL